jgi:DNA (cytosine-5)-methyltransferase 1
MKILNLYSGIGGNRKLWGLEHKITSVELNPEIAQIYSDFFPNDEMIVGDAHQYLLDHYKEYDFIWSSPPCQSHSSFRKNICVRYRGTKPEYPDMRLYQEIIFMQHHCACKWIVENVRPYYQPLIPPSVVIQRHFFWCNFEIKEKDFESDLIRSGQIPSLSKIHGFDLSKYKIQNKRRILRNCVLPELGLHILFCLRRFR